MVRVFRGPVPPILVCRTAIAGRNAPIGATLQHEILQEMAFKESNCSVGSVTQALPDRGNALEQDWPGDRIDLTILDNRGNWLPTYSERRAVPIEGIKIRTDGTILGPDADEARIASMTREQTRSVIRAVLVLRKWLVRAVRAGGRVGPVFGQRYGKAGSDCEVCWPMALVRRR